MRVIIRLVCCVVVMIMLFATESKPVEKQATVVEVTETEVVIDIDGELIAFYADETELVVGDSIIVAMNGNEIIYIK